MENTLYSQNDKGVRFVWLRFGITFYVPFSPLFFFSQTTHCPNPQHTHYTLPTSLSHISHWFTLLIQVLLLKSLSTPFDVFFHIFVVPLILILINTTMRPLATLLSCKNVVSFPCKKVPFFFYIPHFTFLVSFN